MRDRLVYMSNKTRTRLSNEQKSLFHNQSGIDHKVYPIKYVATLIVDFALFKKKKTADNCAAWVHEAWQLKG
jgi:hypothetical protein